MPVVSAASSAEPPESNTSGPYRVMVVDDSVVIRGMLAKALEKDGDISIVASVANGELAIKSAERHNVEVVVLDIEMPVMDGMTALPILLKRDPKIQIIMASTLTLKNAEVSFQALAAGAADYIPKPTSTSEMHGAQAFCRELIEKVRGLGARRRGASTVPPAVGRADSSEKEAKSEGLYGSAPIVLRKSSLRVPQIVAIGSSTGGPQALLAMLKELDKGFRLPVLISQHMPPTFTMILAEHISRVGHLSCAEGVDGEPVEGGKIYLAPGDFHMTVEKEGQTTCIRLLKTPPENFCRPSVDVMFRSVAEAYGAHTLGVILTGMGQDGLQGGDKITAAGGTIIAQDEASSVVWGMPGAVATAGLCSAVLPLSKIPTYIHELIAGKA